MSAPWVVKYRPRSLADVAGNRDAIKELTGWIKDWFQTPPKKRGLLLHGPPGVGKTVSVEAAVRDLHLDLVEVNASDERNRQTIERVVGGASSQNSLYNQRRIILVDEVDGINLQQDRGGLDAIVKCIESSVHPVVLTANDPWNPKIAPLRAVCEMIQFKRLGLREVIPYLKRILAEEGIEADESALKSLHEKNQGDMRSIINDLEQLTVGRKKLNAPQVTSLPYRDRKGTIFQALGLIFSAKDVSQAKRAIDASDVGYEMLFEWIYENLPRQLPDSRDLAVAMERLAKADLFHARAQRSQAWGLLKYYFDLMTAGVGLAKTYSKPGWVSNKFPERIRKMSRLRRTRSLKKAVTDAIASKCHISSKRAASRSLPYIKVIFVNDERMAAKIAEWLELDENGVNLLAGDRPTEDPSG